VGGGQIKEQLDGLQSLIREFMNTFKDVSSFKPSQEVKLTKDQKIEHST
jgi:hypothetical protein